MKKLFAIAMLAIAVGFGSYRYAFVRAKGNRDLLSVEQKKSEDARAQKTAVLLAAETATAVPVWWSPKLRLANLNDIPERLEEKEPSPAQELSFSKGFPPTEKVSISTCSQYLAAIDNGFYPTTNIDEGMESYFTGTCLALRYLEKVKPANTSYLEPNGWSNSALSILPPILCDLGVEGSIADKVLAARSAGQSWGDFDSTLKLTESDGNTLTATSGAYQQDFSLEILAKGDFNDDGIEDWLVLGYTNSNRGGTFHESAFYILTRLGPNATMHVVLTQ